ncbi:ABC transporter permease [Paenibacillus brevis]|uniref:Autoinducer 2 import system permease protein LsrD n=1 Tax=Paenibacillus brevis TaxID=2841508 RepID=A0ABS6FLA0_9BACL|nr:ABC transporter permease [Paenibacillus brevis]MBU5670228.1 ABC transporter permease [Paenibacillus brevis]
MKLFFKKHQHTLIQYAGLVLVLLVFTLMTDGALLSEFNVRTILKQLVILFTITVGMIFIFSHGGMDISVGAVLALSSMAAIYTMNAGAPLVLGILVAVFISVLCYMINVLIANQFGLMAAIASLAIMIVSRGIVTYQVSTSVTKIALVDVKPLRELGRNMPLIVTIIVLVGVVGYVLFHLTKMGKQNKAIGDNPLAASQSGVRVNRTKVIAYLLAGILVGFASILSLSRSAVISENTGMGLEMDVIVALILGGMALNGGSRSRMSSAFVGSITLVLLNNGLVMVGVPPEVVSLVKGMIFLVVVFLLLRRPATEVMPR